MIFKEKNAPRWLVFSIDLITCAASIYLAYLLRFNFEIQDRYADILGRSILFILALRAVSFYMTRTYASIVRHTSTTDALRIVVAITGSTLIISLSNFVHNYFFEKFFIPLSVIIIDYITAIFLMSSFRILVKILYQEFGGSKTEKRKVIIYGAGQSGLITKRTLEKDRGTRYKVIAFVDDNPAKANKRIEGVPVYYVAKSFDNLIRNRQIDQLIISIQNISIKRKKELIENCLSHNVKVLSVPEITTWINGELSFKQIKKVKIEDLLEREPIQLESVKIKQQILGKTVLITGAAGSIGSGLIEEIVKFYPEKMILLDQAESPLYEMELHLLESTRNINYEFIIGDIKDKERLKYIFETFKPHFVFHAAAYKHVPMMEGNPREAAITNIMGTKNLADLSVKHNIEKFVMISTDKAVNPTSIMGASKRIAEIYVQSLNTVSSTRFITTRFGNVLGSNGSVIPRFKKQIESGGPVTVTHPEINRFFMTIPEACQLVLEAGAMGNGGEIFLFDMGDSVKIVDLAKKMIKLSGLTLGKDIQLKFSGLRPGEKLYEELLNDQENTKPTHHPKIMIAQVREYDFKTISQEVEELVELSHSKDNLALVKKMKQIVPEFISKNSVYEVLDRIETETHREPRIVNINRTE